MALDEAPLQLQRIFRFLTRKSDLAAQLLTIQRHADPDGTEVFVPRLVVDPAAEPKAGTGVKRPQKSMDELLAACTNPFAVEFFKQRSNMEMNSNDNALAYRYHGAGEIHWYVSPIPAGAEVLQIDRFPDDEHFWSGLSKANIRPHLSKGKDNLQFDLIAPTDFDMFKSIAEDDAGPNVSNVWMKPSQ